ncbi:MAG: HYR domain-containing protein [Candidatus Didemnitutus sp.]|nr:HYR domain-containing protein [Candidatus Didemnitutus sp.]
MNTHTHPTRVGPRMRALRFFASVALAAGATLSSRGDVVFSRNTTTAEPWAAYSATFTPTVSGNYSFGFNLTAGGPSGDNSILVDAVKITQGATTVFSDGFETPNLAANSGSSASGGTATIGNWTCTNYSGVLDGSPPNWGLAAQGLGTADGTTQYAYLQAVFGTLGKIKAVNTVSLVAGQTYTISFYQASRHDFGGTTSYTVTLDYVPPTVYASGLSPVIAYDPIFPSYPVVPDSLEGKPAPTVGYDDPRWTNPHPATSFPIGSHPWEFIAPYDFSANWINAWSNMNSDGHGFPGNANWARWDWNIWGYNYSIYQSWTKYSTIINGNGSYVLQFLADNASWIYIDSQLIGYQDYSWGSNGTGRYTINLTGNGPHELSFVIWDGGGLAGGKFRLETTQSFSTNNPGVPLPPAPPASDTTAPVITAPADIVTEATGPAGATVTFTATATDDKDGTVPVTAAPASGSTFALGVTAVGLAASDAAGNTATASFDVTVQDTTAPVITAPANITTEATSAAGAAVSYTASAYDLVDNSTTVIGTPASGSTFALGTTTVALSSSDSRHNTSSKSFTVTVQDTTAPVITAPANIVAEATSANGAAVSYSASATDLVDGNTAVSGSPASGSVFALGTTSVALASHDAHGNASSASFSVTVRDTTAPVLNVPANQVIEATSAVGAVATFNATATDAVGVTSLTTSVASGSTFPIGTTTVSVTAADAAGNAASGSFTVTVQDTTAPALHVPANQVIEATSAAGAVATFNATATDAVGVTSLTTSAASGATFPIGTTTISVVAQDAAGNTSSGSFTVTVRDTTAPAITATLTPRRGGGDDESAQFFTIAFASTDAVGVKTLTAVLNGVTVTNGQVVQLQLKKSGAQTVKRDDGKLQIKATSFALVVTATDAAGNVATKTIVPVFVKNGKDDKDDDDKGGDKNDGKKDDDKGKSSKG